MNAATSVLSGVHPVSARRHQPRRILLVEDDAPVRELLRLHLSLAGFDIAEVANGTAALDLARSERFDLIVLDVMVPGLDGITLCRAIRSHSLNTASAVLMLTAHASEADKVLGLESGADDYLTKPFGVREMVARPGIVYSRAALLTKVWTDDTFVTERTVDTVISRLRRKIEHDAQRPELILTAWGVGYKFADVD